MKKLSLVFCLLLLTVLSAFADEREKDISRLQAAGQVLDEIMAAPDKGIPASVLGGAECVAIVPSLLKGGFVFGADYGKGVATCRTPIGWSAPAFFNMTGGSFGLQIGGQAVDLVMVIMNQRGMQALLSSHFKLGADASVAGGPIGRDAEGMTDLKMRAQVLTYSRARGVFAGVALNGAVVKQNNDDTRAFYGRMIPFKTLLTGGVPAPNEAQPFINAVVKHTAEKTANSAEPAKAAPSGTDPAAPAAPGTTVPPATSDKPSPAPAKPGDTANPPKAETDQPKFI